MRAFVIIPSCVGALAAAVGCASLLSIPDRTAEWCLRPENAHAFCEDFDHPDAEGAWSLGTPPAPGVSRTYPASGASPPSALDLSVDPLEGGAQGLTAIENDFPQRSFDHVHVEADVRFVQEGVTTVNGVSTGLGFLLLELKPDICIGVGLSPPGVAVVIVAKSLDCSTARNATPDSGFSAGPPIATDDGGTAPNVATIVSKTPIANKWLRVTLDVKRGADGSGAVTFNITGVGAGTPPQIPPGGLPASGVPAIALAASVTGPSGPVELQFDNITVDF